MDEQVVAFDFARMFWGDTDALFFLEILFRTVFIYAYTLILIRWIGSRSIGQLSLVEFLLVIALGSAVGDAMFYPEVPLAHCVAVITIVVLLDKGLSYLVVRNPAIEDAIEGKSVAIVTDGIIHHRELLKFNLGYDELFEQLRMKDVEHLGQVRGAYFETNGLISVFLKKTNHRVGLSIVPPWDVERPKEYHIGSKPDEASRFACIRCATVIQADQNTALVPCPLCRGQVYHVAVADEKQGEEAQATA